MTTKIEGGEELKQVVTSQADIVAHLERHAKPRDQFKVGMEYERLGVRLSDGRAIPYDGPGGVEAILGLMVERHGWTAGRENGRITWLERQGAMITLEPGGQTEFSSAPEKTISVLMDRARAAGAELDDCAAAVGAVYLGLGYQPFSSVEEIAWVPKARYGAMAPYLARKGRLAHFMMKMTAGCQVAVDYADGADAMRKLRAAVLCTPIAQALFAASGIAEGRPLPYATWRARIWTETDEERCNVPEFMLHRDVGLEDYAAWLMDMPLMFVEREGRFEDGTGWTLRRLMKEARPTVYDLETIMTQAFPEARLKRFLEIRSLDSPQPYLLATVPCFWSSILYGEIQAIFDLLGHLSVGEFTAMRDIAIREGLRGVFQGRTLAAWARELINATIRTWTCEWSMKKLMARIETMDAPVDRARRLLAESADPAEFVKEWNNYRG